VTALKLNSDVAGSGLAFDETSHSLVVDLADYIDSSMLQSGIYVPVVFIKLYMFLDSVLPQALDASVVTVDGGIVMNSETKALELDLTNFISSDMIQDGMVHISH